MSNKKLLSSSKIGPKLFKALGITDPVERLEIILEANEPVVVNIKFVPYQTTEKALEVFSDEVVQYILVANP